ncbi:rubredoxin [endosymbiont of unidentified scaly snail isolate Monju]|jgi:rubredoxin|uniref:rubredoxin n=1 Tax=endosymbiont of unidentified scaly snail isolate Monju TaxID=1248727 RepID=UPI0003892021|nr:rubredoxin [endosymbiont of unidentified scaly snail isolate Monju]BAN70047.1 rubredoxin-type Fe(Cys)4 protein, HoxR [endosymbiont of unidentified scaly snail isolate Monju]
MKTFEGSYMGDNTRIPDDARMECKVCWYVYDPAEGDDYWQIPPGTPFSQLPDHWRCPQCEGAREQFMVILEDR